MSYVCLWSPSWARDPEPEVPADLPSLLLSHAPRVIIASVPQQRIWIDARGLHPPALASKLLDIARAYGLPDARAGAASTPVAAEVAATLGDNPLTIVPPGQDRDFMAPFPVGTLDPPPFLMSLFEGTGIETCGHLAALEAESVEIRFGAEGVRLWRRARADDDRILFRAPLRALPSASLEWTEYALRDPERLVFVINSLAGSVCAALAAQGERAREIALVFSLANRSSHVQPLRSSRPSADPKRWLRIVRDMLDRVRLPDAVVGVTLRVDSVTGNDGAQGDLFDRGFASAESVESALAQLVDDQGADALVAPRNSAHPLLDARTTWVPEDPARVAAGSIAGTAAAAATAAPELTLQVVTPPRAVLVTTTPRRDHEAPARYRDEDGWHSLVSAAGPERVSGGQWDAPYAREYFCCVREDGVLVWLYRADDRWYLHGWWD